MMNILKRYIIALITILYAFGNIHGAENVPLSPREILESISGNSTFKIGRLQNEAQQNETASSNSLDSPEIEFEHLWAPKSPTKWSLTVSQSFDWPGLYSARKQLNARNGHTAALIERARMLQMKLDAKSIMIKLAYNAKKAALTQNMIENIEEISKNLDFALSHGLVTILDKSKADIETASLIIELDELNAEKQNLISELVQLLGTSINFDSVDWSDIPGLQTLADYNSYVEELAYEPNLLAARNNDEAAEIAAKVARMTSMPSLSIGYTHQKEEYANYNGFTFSLTLPGIWGNKKRKATADLSLEASRLLSERQSEIYMARIKNDYNSATRLRSQIETLRQKGLGSQQYLNLMDEAVKAGELTYFDYLREKSAVYTLNIKLLDIEQRYTLLLASLNRYRD